MIQSAKNALITGAYGGLGRSLADAYLKAGHNLFLLGRNEQKLNKLKKYLESVNVSNRIIKCYPCDLRDVSSIDETINLIESEYEIDILINCAGTFPVKSLSQTSLRDYQDCMQINVQAPFLLMQRLSKNMIKNKWGRIVNIASSSAYGGSPSTSVYCASKHALLGLSRSLYKELKTDNVRVFCVSPGSIQTEMGRDVEKLGQLYDTFMTPAEVAEYICYATSFDGHMISEEIRLNRVFVQ